MNIYNFHGEIEISNIGKELRKIIFSEKLAFKILTGYGSTCMISKSKNAALKSLMALKKQSLIKGFFPGDVRHTVLDQSSPYYEDKIKYSNIVKKDEDYGNPGIIFVFL